MRPHREIYKEVEWALSRTAEPAEKEGGHLKRADITVETYETGKGDYMVDIVRGTDGEEGGTAYEAWLYRRSGGIKTHVFSMDEDVKYSEFRLIIEDLIEKADDLSVMTADGEEG